MNCCKCYSPFFLIIILVYIFKHSTEEYIKWVESKEWIKLGGNADRYFYLLIGSYFNILYLYTFYVSDSIDTFDINVFTSSYLFKERYGYITGKPKGVIQLTG